MTDKEILAELKTSYLNLEDIIENQDKQISRYDNTFLMQAMQNISFVYEQVWKEVYKTNKETLLYEKDIMIADVVYKDNLVNEKDYICYDDTENKTKWWENYDFLMKG